MAIAKNIITKSGPWYAYGDLKVSGKESMKNTLLSNEELFNEVRDKIINESTLAVS